MSELSDAAMETLGNPSSDSAGAGLEEPIKKRRGRPPGSKNRPKDASGNPIKEEPRSASIGFVYMKDENSVKASIALGMTVWFLASLMLPVRSLTEEEGTMLGEALDPVLCRWIPVFGEWKYEAGLLMVIMTLYFATAKDRTPPNDAITESIETQPQGSAAG